MSRRSLPNSKLSTWPSLARPLPLRRARVEAWSAKATESASRGIGLVPDQERALPHHGICVVKAIPQ